MSRSLPRHLGALTALGWLSAAAPEPRPRRLCDVLSAALVRPPRTRRQLLELRDISKRVDLLSAELARLIRELQGGTASGPN